MLLDDAAEAENRDDADWFADVQHDFMSLKMMPKVCEHPLHFVSGEHVVRS